MENFCIARERLHRKLFPTLPAAGCRVARRTIRSRLKREGVGRQQVRRRLPVPQPADEQQGSLLQSKPDDPEFQVLPPTTTTDGRTAAAKMTTDGGEEEEEENIEPSILKFGVSYRFSPAPPPPPQHKKKRRNECYNTSARKMTRPPNGYFGERARGWFPYRPLISQRVVQLIARARSLA